MGAVWQEAGAAAEAADVGGGTAEDGGPAMAQRLSRFLHAFEPELGSNACDDAVAKLKPLTLGMLHGVLAHTSRPPEQPPPQQHGEQQQAGHARMAAVRSALHMLVADTVCEGAFVGTWMARE